MEYPVCIPVQRWSAVTYVCVRAEGDSDAGRGRDGGAVGRRPRGPDAAALAGDEPPAAGAARGHAAQEHHAQGHLNTHDTRDVGMSEIERRAIASERDRAK